MLTAGASMIPRVDLRLVFHAERNASSRERDLIGRRWRKKFAFSTRTTSSQNRAPVAYRTTRSVDFGAELVSGVRSRASPDGTARDTTVI